MLSEIADGHPPCDLDPFSADVRLFDNLSFALHQDPSIEASRFVDAKKATLIALQVPCPGRPRPRHDKEDPIAELEPARHNIRPAILVQAAQPTELTLGEKSIDLLHGEPADFASPFFLLFRHHTLRSTFQLCLPQFVAQQGLS